MFALDLGPSEVVEFTAVVTKAGCRLALRRRYGAPDDPAALETVLMTMLARSSEGRGPHENHSSTSACCRGLRRQRHHDRYFCSHWHLEWHGDTGRWQQIGTRHGIDRRHGQRRRAIARWTLHRLFYPQRDGRERERIFDPAAELPALRESDRMQRHHARLDDRARDRRQQRFDNHRQRYPRGVRSIPYGHVYVQRP